MTNNELIVARPVSGVQDGNPATMSHKALRLSFYFLLLVTDCAAITLAFLAAAHIRGDAWISPDGVNLGLLVVPIFLFVSINRSAYSIGSLESFSESIRRPLTALFVTMLMVLMLGFFAKAGLSISRLAFSSAIAMSAGLLVVGRFSVIRLSRKIVNGSFRDELLILDDVDIQYQPGARVMDAKAEGLVPDMQDPVMLARIAQRIGAFDRIIIACSAEKEFAWSLLLKGSGISGEFIMHQNHMVGAIGINTFQSYDTMVVSRGALSLTNQVKKRVFDLVLTIPVLIFLAPFFLAVAIAIRLETPGSVLFFQRRVGQGNRLFHIIKFRSMRTETSDGAGSQSTVRDDQRITRVGRLIRKTSIDELPQLINVLRGDMSLVGPRPHALGSLAGDQLFWEVNERYWMRHALKPGITGLAQIRGFRGATHHRQDLEDRLQSDLEYLSGWRLWRDVTILLGTARVLLHRNAY